MEAGQLKDDNGCFACGKDNPYGLKMQVTYTDSQARCSIKLPQQFQGWHDRAHGGVIYTLMDEIMAHAVIHFLGQAVTTSSQTTFRAPVPLNQELRVSGWISKRRSRGCVAEAKLESAHGGRLLAQASANFILAKEARP